MAPNRGRNRAAEFEALVETGGKDFDPEADDVPADDSSDIEDAGSSDEDDDEEAAREHYVAVGKSKLRKPKELALGPAYVGRKVGRDALESEDDHDILEGLGSEDEEEDSEDGFGQEEEGSEEGSEEDEDDVGNGTSDTEMSDVDGEEEEAINREDSKLKKELSKAMGDDMKRSVTASISQASKEDAEKGRAVKKQRTAFDSLLNARMKLQKSLIATNTLVGLPAEQIQEEKSEANDALLGAEIAAFNLWNSLNTFREDLLSARAPSKKRKRTHFTSSTPTSTLLDHLTTQESTSLPHRNAVLQKWSLKSQGPTVQTSSSRLTTQTSTQTTIIDVLNSHLSNPTRLLSRTQQPRSCAPLQLSQALSSDAKIYDDADFYSLLLKELLEQKSADSITASAIDVGYQVRKEAKTKKNVDIKASKGRKLRYTVHEKLQNFMAPEDRGRWGERQAEELFGSLFGQRVGLGEEEVEREDDEGMEEEGLMLFRS
ncbi:unnamed protein product [Zymoseptoria tritici ST99CH_3D1]|nr:unnamed protein product [Zymoseptoria tritici ST99CH_3D1]